MRYWFIIGIVLSLAVNSVAGQKWDWEKKKYPNTVAYVDAWETGMYSFSAEKPILLK